MATRESYVGPERRIHRVFVTRNTEYHLRRDVCVGVRDRQTGRWREQHEALAQRVCGGIRIGVHGAVISGAELPQVGDSLLFDAAGRDVVTSSVISVERPPRDVVANYRKFLPLDRPATHKGESMVRGGSA